MPKSGFSANSQAKVAANAIVRAHGRTSATAWPRSPTNHVSLIGHE